MLATLAYRLQHPTIW